MPSSPTEVRVLSETNRDRVCTRWGVSLRCGYGIRSDFGLSLGP